jgi:hypothetical protein
MYSYAQDEYFMMKTTPDEDHYAALPQIPPPKRDNEKDNPR